MDKERTIVISFNQPTAELRQWFIQKGFDAFIPVTGVSPLVCARNTAFREALKHQSEYDHVILCDNDVYPAAATAEWLTLDTDLTSCRCDMNAPFAWQSADCFHFPLSSVRMSVLAQLTTPFVLHDFSPDGCKLNSCECMTFAKRCKQLGATVSHGGWCSHLHRGAWHNQ